MENSAENSCKFEEWLQAVTKIQPLMKNYPFGFNYWVYQNCALLPIGEEDNGWVLELLHKLYASLKNDEKVKV